MLRAFLDASALFSGVHSPNGAMRELLKWHLQHKIALILSDYVIRECLKNLQEDYPHQLGSVELLLDFMQAEIVAPTREDIEKAAVFTVPKDAPVVAAAMVGECSHLLTFDRADLITPPKVATQSGLIILTPGELLRQLRSQA